MHMCDNHDRLRKNCKVELKKKQINKQTNKENKTRQDYRGISTNKSESRRGWTFNV